LAAIDTAEIVKPTRADSTLSDSFRGRHLSKSLRWWDGFILALAVPIYLFPDLGASAVQLGVMATIAVWLLSVIMGALQTNIYVEMALMFPHKSGSLPSYAREAYDRYTPLVGPLVAWGYWMGWCVVLSINGLLVGSYLRAAFFPSADPVLFPKIVGSLMLLIMMGIDLVGLRAGKAIRYVLGVAVMIPVLIIMFGVYFSGHFNPANLTNQLGIPGTLGTWGSVSIFMYWLYIAGWSSYAFEAVAVHAPEYKNTLRDTPRALRTSALFSVIVYGLVPLGLIATLGTAGISANTLLPFDKALKTVLGGGGGFVTVLMVIAALILAAQMSAIASVRALWQMAENGLTVTGFSRLNRWSQPDAAIIFTYAINILLIWTVGDVIWLIAASNVGYVGSHIVALGAYLLLRKDRPKAVRPIKHGPAWVYLAGILLVVNLSAMLIGAPVYGAMPLLGGLAIVSVLAFGLYAARRYLQPSELWRRRWL
jgi:amino acid transporter